MSRRKVVGSIYTHEEPVNQTAANVMFLNGASYEPQYTLAKHLRFDTPPPMRPVPAGHPDWTGTAWGRLAVLGLAAITRMAKRTRGPAWVVRCACGVYEHRSSHAIRDKHDPDECCRACQHVRRLKEGRFVEGEDK